LPFLPQVSSYLFQRTSPQRVLLPEHVLAMVGDWTGLLVVSGVPLVTPLVEALLRSGAKAVIAPAEEAWARALQHRGLAVGGMQQVAAVALDGAAAWEAPAEEREVGGVPPRLLVRTTGSFGLLASATDLQSAFGDLGALPQQLQNHPGRPSAGFGVAISSSIGDFDAAVMRFFEAFYEALFAEETVLGAIQAGEEAEPEVDGLFVCHHL
jgi:hypothetical protein